MQKNIKKEKREAKENNSGGLHAEIDASGSKEQTHKKIINALKNKGII